MPRSKTKTEEPDYLRRAYDDLLEATAAWRQAHDAWEADPTSWCEAQAIEAARHDLQMARGRVVLEEAALEAKNRRDGAQDKSWGSH